MEFFDFEQADTADRLTNVEQDSELANLFASISPSVPDVDFFSEDIRAPNSLDNPISNGSLAGAIESDILGTLTKSDRIILVY